MIHITVHDPSTVDRSLHHGVHAGPSMDLIVRTEPREGPRDAVYLIYRTPEALRDLAREAQRAASELSTAIAAQDRVSA